MKRVLAVALCALVVFGVVLSSAPASASETDWRVFFKGFSPSGAVTGNVCTIGTKPGAPPDVIAFSGSGNGVNIAAYEPLPTPFYSTDLKSPIVPPQTRVWDLLFWCDPAYQYSTAKLVWWSSMPYLPPATIGGVPYKYTLEVIQDPTGEWAGAKWVLTPGATGSYADPLGAVTWGANGLKTSVPTDGVKLRFTAAPVPEPSSIAALLCGLGGIGMIWRRRK